MEIVIHCFPLKSFSGSDYGLKVIKAPSCY